MDEEQEIDYTEEIQNETTLEINKLTKEIKQLETSLKYPAALKNSMAGGLLGYILARRLSKDNNIAIIGSLLSGYASFNMFKGKDLTTEQKHAINEQIQARKNKLISLGVEIKADTIGVLSAEELESMDYDKYIFGDDDYGLFMGNPAVGFHALVFGLPKSGKSIWSLRFANYLANHFGNVLYIASEEGFKGTIKQKISEWTDNRQNLKFGNFLEYEEIRDNIQDYDFVFIDSLDFAKITVDEMEELKQLNKNISFVTIKQVTKDGKFRGSQEYAHNCDIIISIDDGIASQKGRYNPAAEMEVFTKPQEVNE